jgi:hypothetical protein
MSYHYATEKPKIFTEDGQILFLKIRDNAKRLLAQAGAVRCGELISCATGDSWTMLACVDRMVELGELREITKDQCVAGQHRVFVDAH